MDAVEIMGTIYLVQGAVVPSVTPYFEMFVMQIEVVEVQKNSQPFDLARCLVKIDLLGNGRL